MLMLDLDHFKSINDNFGHPAGDAVLQDVANVVVSQVRPADIAARYGGEEIAVILPNTSLEDALAGAERLRHAIANRPLQGSGARSSIAVTVSIGAAAVDAFSGTASMLLRNADEALYKAKRSGRNCVSVHESPRARTLAARFCG